MWLKNSVFTSFYPFTLVKLWRALFLFKFGAVIVERGTTDPVPFSQKQQVGPHLTKPILHFCVSCIYLLMARLKIFESARSRLASLRGATEWFGRSV
jgi:hypothetical protein